MTGGVIDLISDDSNDTRPSKRILEPATAPTRKRSARLMSQEDAVNKPIEFNPNMGLADHSQKVFPPSISDKGENAINDSNQLSSNPTQLIGPWKQLESQLRCDICKSLMDVPVSLSRCFHTFCSYCIRRDFELGNNDRKCPCCRMPASSSDIRLEPRLAQILKILREDNFRKKLRHRIKQGSSDLGISDSCNSTFQNQDKLSSLFSQGGEVIVRTVLPLYNNLKEKQIRDLAVKDGLAPPPKISRDDLVRFHKEFLLYCQALFDATRMGMYPAHPPTKEGVAKFFTTTKMPLLKLLDPQTALIDRLTDDAQQRMRQQLLLRRGKGRNGRTDPENAEKCELPQN